MAKMKNVQDLLQDEIKDLYSAEKQLTKALPKLITNAMDAQLKAGLSAHLDETEQQVARLETIAKMLEIKATGKVCEGMKGLVKEGAKALATEAPPEVYDLGIIAAARRVEHYEIAGYMTAIALADELKLAEVSKLLRQTLFEEKGAEDSLKSHAQGMVRSSLSKDAPPGRPIAKQASHQMAETA